MRLIWITVVTLSFCSPAFNQALFNVPPVSPVSTEGGQAAASADFNEDGLPDLAVSSVQSTAIMLNQGGYRFVQTTQSQYGLRGGSYMVAGDFNGDGHVDLALFDIYDHEVVILLGVGDGTFREGPVFATLSSGNGSGLFAGDVNGDGKLDLVSCGIGDAAFDSGSYLQTLLGNGDGTFSVQTAQSFGESYGGFEGLILADFNQDGLLDAATLGLSPENPNPTLISVAYGKGDGTFQNLAVVAQASFGATAIAFADLNADGLPDILFAGTSGSASTSFQRNLTVLLNSSNGSFQAQNYLASFNPTARGPNTNELIVVGDFNGDDIQDVFVPAAGIDGDGQSFLWPGVGGGELGPPQTSWTLPAIAAFPGFFNKPGVLDVGLAGAYSVSAAPYAGRNSFVGPVVTANAIEVPEIQDTADFNGDGLTDLLISTLRGFAVAMAAGDGNFQVNTYILTAEIRPAAAAGDLNGDGKADVAMLTGTPEGHTRVTTYLGNGDGTFGSAVLATTIPSPYGSDVVARIADFDGDGKNDIVFLSSEDEGDANLYFLHGNGDGTFLPYYVASLAGTGRYAAFLAVADFNGDGIADFAVSNGSSLLVYSGVKGGLPSRSFGYKPDELFVEGLTTGDFNGDGIPDIALAGDVQGEPFFFTFPGAGDGTFGAPVLSPNNDSYPILSIDINGDGNLDLISGQTDNALYFGVFAFLGDGHGKFTAAGDWLLIEADDFAVGHFTSDNRVGVVGCDIGGLAVIEAK